MIKALLWFLSFSIAIIYSGMLHAGGHSETPILETPISDSLTNFGVGDLTLTMPDDPSLLDWNTFCGPNAICGNSVPVSGIKALNACELPGANCASSAVLQPVTPSTDSYPYVVALLKKGSVSCTGVLISPNNILTAAHCLCDSLPDEAFIGTSIYDGDVSDIGFKRRIELSDSVSFMQHAFCSARTPFTVNPHLDLATIKTQHPIELGSRFTFDIKNHIATPPTNTTSTIVGFGASSQSNSGGVKRRAFVQTKPCDSSNIVTTDCLLGKERVAINETSQDVDTCKGDSGGPLLFSNPTRTTKLAGITSRRISQSLEKFCGSGGVYVSLNQPSVLSWLHNMD